MGGISWAQQLLLMMELVERTFSTSPFMSLTDVQIEESARIWEYLQIVAITILVWDHLLTLDIEVNYLWKKPRNLSGLLFFTNRYYNLFSKIVVIVTIFDIQVALSCEQLNSLKTTLLFLSSTLTGVVMSLRVYALYACSKCILVLLVSAATVAITTAAVLEYALHGSQFQLLRLSSGRCVEIYDDKTVIKYSFVWIIVFVYDVFNFSLAVWNAFKTRQELRILKNRTSLKVILLRDGAAYFGVVSLAVLANILSHFLEDGVMKGGLGWLANSISVVSVSRLFLNLHEVMDEGVYASNWSGIQSNVIETRIVFAERQSGESRHA